MQDEVEQISMMKPIAQGPHGNGLLEYLEDIIGTDKHISSFLTTWSVCDCVLSLHVGRGGADQHDEAHSAGAP